MIANDIAAAAARLQQWLVQDALPIWSRVGVDRDGAFHEAIAPSGTALAGLDRRARVQARQIYVYATAVDMGWGGADERRWRNLVHDGLVGFLMRYRRADGLIRASVHPDGSPANQDVLLYDQAFTLFALAAVYRIDPNTEWLLQARELLNRVRTRFGHINGGFREASDAHPFQSNPHMHLCEAALAWSKLDPQGPWPAVADELMQLCLTAFIDLKSGVLREFFGTTWAPAPGPDGRLAWPGHQFEWAWLLASWGQAQKHTPALVAAERLFHVASEAGVDRQRGVAINAVRDDLEPIDRSARLWPQTERIKAAMILADLATDLATRQARIEEAVGAVRGLELYLATPIAGLWRDTLEPSGRFTEGPAPASSFYHITCAIAEVAIRTRSTLAETGSTQMRRGPSPVERMS